jgi:hypothetical protein
LCLGADASQKHDYTALIGTIKGEYTDVRFVKVWKPKRGPFGKAQPIDLEQTIGAEVIRLHKAGQVQTVCYDPWQLATVAKQWERAGIRCVEMPQTQQRVEADTALFDAIVSGRLRHPNNADLTEAVTNAVTLETPRGVRIAKEKASKKIDALVALSMSNHAAVTQITGQAEAMPNPFYGDYSLSEYIVAGGKWIYAPKANRRAHRPGVT